MKLASTYNVRKTFEKNFRQVAMLFEHCAYRVVPLAVKSTTFSDSSLTPALFTPTTHAITLQL